MLFIVSWKICSENRNHVIERFLKTGGVPPEGVKMHGRWYAVGGAAGVGIADQVRDAIATEGKISKEEAAKQIW